MTNSTKYTSANVSMNGQKLQMTSFKYLRATLCKDGICSVEISIRIASAMAAMARVNGIWRYNTISFTSRLNKSLVTSVHKSFSTAVKHKPCLLTL